MRDLPLSEFVRKRICEGLDSICETDFPLILEGSFPVKMESVPWDKEDMLVIHPFSPSLSQRFLPELTLVFRFFSHFSIFRRLVQKDWWNRISEVLRVKTLRLPPRGKVPEIRYLFGSFFPGTNPNDNYFTRVFKELAFSVRATEAGEAHILIFSWHENWMQKFPDRFRIWWTGENARPPVDQYEFCLSHDFVESKKHFRLPFWALSLAEWVGESTEHRSTQVSIANLKNRHLNRDLEAIVKRERKIGWVTYHPTPERDLLFEGLKDQIVSWGKAYQTIDEDIGGKGAVDMKLGKLRTCQMTIAVENASSVGYVTEKALHALAVDSVPIYWGPLNRLEEDFNPEAMIWEKTIVKLIERVKNITPEELKKILSQPIFINPPERFAPSQAARAILDSLEPTWDRKCGPFNGDPIVANQVEHLIRELKVEVAVETGTFHGTVSDWLARRVKRVYTVEILPQNFQEAQQFLQGHNHLTQILGSSDDALKRLLPRVAEETKAPVLFYLDAHWEDHWPLLNEIWAIGQNLRDRAILVIDDFKVPGTDFYFDCYRQQPNNWEFIRKAVEASMTDPVYWYNWHSDRPERGVGKLYCVPRALFNPAWVYELEVGGGKYNFGVI